MAELFSMESRIADANRIIMEYLPSKSRFDGEIIDAMEYSLMAGGKRIRPILIESFCRLFNGDDKLTHPFMAAIEMLHTYSLVHDDLPALDNDELRRGMPTTHKQFGEPLAILAGDGLLHLAYETIINNLDATSLQKQLSALKIFGKKTGIYGMLGGQTADVINTGKTVDDDLLMYIYELKTGALIEGSMMIGAALAGVDQNTIDKVYKIGHNIGLAFQIKDDILDIEGDEKELGKPINSDARNNKKTYVTIHGRERSISMIEKLSTEAKDILVEIGKNKEETDFLIKLFDYLVDRNS